jgi:hypothetical protein
MSTKLGELLVKEGAITRKQLEEALKCQVIFGGRLGTNLVEMGFIDEQALVETLSRQLEVPFVSAEQLMSVSAEVINLISREMAEEYKIIPLSLDKKRLTIAIWDPSDLAAIDAISFITGYIIKPLVCSELRLLLALEQYYGIKREVRYIQLRGGTGTRSREAASGSRGGTNSGSEGIETSPFEDLMDELPPPPPAETVGNDAVWGDRVDIRPPDTPPEPLLKRKLPEPAPEVQPTAERAPVVHEAPREDARQSLPTTAPGTELPAAQAAPMEPAASHADTLLARLAEAGSRDAIADALVDYLGRDFERVALFMVKGRIAVGWKGIFKNAPISGFDHLQVPLDDPTLLRIVVDTKNFYLGPILDSPGNARILTGLGGGQPDSVLLIPLIMMERVVTVFYVDGDKGLLGNKLFELQKLIGKASLAFEILILKNKIMLA